MGTEILWRLWPALGIAICSVLLFFIGRAYEASKMKGLKDELKRLRNWKESSKALCEKLKDGKRQSDYLSIDLNKFKRAKRLSPLRGKKSESQFEIVTQGNPKNA